MFDRFDAQQFLEGLPVVYAKLREVLGRYQSDADIGWPIPVESWQEQQFIEFKLDLLTLAEQLGQLESLTDALRAESLSFTAADVRSELKQLLESLQRKDYRSIQSMIDRSIVCRLTEHLHRWNAEERARLRAQAAAALPDTG